VVHAAVITPPVKLRNEQNIGTFEALIATPTSPEVLLLAGAVYEVALALVESVIVIVLAVVFFDFSPSAGPLDLLALTAGVIGTVGCFLSLGVMLAALGVVVKQIGGLAMLVPTVLAVLGGVYSDRPDARRAAHPRTALADQLGPRRGASRPARRLDTGWRAGRADGNGGRGAARLRGRAAPVGGSRQERRNPGALLRTGLG